MFRRLSMRWLAALPLLACLAADAATPRADTRVDSWGVRLLGERLESLSEVNHGKPAARSPLASRVIANRGAPDAEIEVRADAAVAAALASEGDYAAELDHALAWLQRLQHDATVPARIALTLVDARHHHRVRRVHGTGDGLAVDLVVAMPANPAHASVEVGRALSTALHEMSHAVTAISRSRQRPDRRGDEYRASLVQACYTADTLRVGDTLRLAPRPGATAREHFVTGYSRDAARRVVLDLIRAAGRAAIPWHDEAARQRLRQACHDRLGTPPGPMPS